MNGLQTPNAKESATNVATCQLTQEKEKERKSDDKVDPPRESTLNPAATETKKETVGNTTKMDPRETTINPPTTETKKETVGTSTPKKKAKKVPREKLKDGEMVRSELYLWKVIQILGSGGFGDVYKVTKEYDMTDGKEYAMKTEMVEGEKRMLRLKIEVTVLTECQSVQDPKKKMHFVEMADRGKNDKFKFVVMGLVGKSLEDIRKKHLGKNFGRSTAMQAAMQTLQSVWDLHDLGWLHRDIKPQNFAVGIGDKESTVYMLDFGIAKKMFKKGTREMKVPRAKVKFLGTLRFASRACHNGLEQGRKDDLEAWLYMVFDLFDRDAGLPWKKTNVEKAAIPRQKAGFFKGIYSNIYNIVPREFKQIVKYVDELAYTDDPDYKYIMITMKSIAKEHDISLEKKPDWTMKRSADVIVPVDKEDETSEDRKQSGSEDSDSEESATRKKRKSKGKSGSRNSEVATKKGGGVSKRNSVYKASANANKEKNRSKGNKR